MASLARDHGLHPSRIHKLLARYRAEGESGLALRSKRRHSSQKADRRNSPAQKNCLSAVEVTLSYVVQENTLGCEIFPHLQDQAIDLGCRGPGL